jgi:hypothetical protein
MVEKERLGRVIVGHIGTVLRVEYTIVFDIEWKPEA